MAIVAINFNDGHIVGKINFQNLKKYFPNYNNSGIVVEQEDWLNQEGNGKYNYYFISEILN